MQRQTNTSLKATKASLKWRRKRPLKVVIVLMKCLKNNTKQKKHLKAFK